MFRQNAYGELLELPERVRGMIADLIYYDTEEQLGPDQMGTKNNLGRVIRKINMMADFLMRRGTLIPAEMF